MADRICIYAEHYGGKPEPAVYELVTAAKELCAYYDDAKIAAIYAGSQNDEALALLKKSGADEVHIIDTKGEDVLLQDDAVSAAISALIKKLDPEAVLVPATAEGRSIFSRVAMRLGCGMTADCTGLSVKKREDGSKYIEQLKPSFGDNILVTIVTKPEYRPQMMTVRPGVYPAYGSESEPGGERSEICGGMECKEAETFVHDDIKLGKSGVKVVSVSESNDSEDSLMSAEIVVVAGRGALKDGNFGLLKKFAEKIGAEIGGTRPVADAGIIPFDHQIGQTGFTIRPEICISLGVSGAIQHTEGIKDTKLYIAINEDENAAIFNYADYGAVADIKDILEACI